MTDYTLPTAMLARLFTDAAETEELRHGATQAAETMSEQQRQIHALSQERLRESERAAAAERLADVVEVEVRRETQQNLANWADRALAAEQAHRAAVQAIVGLERERDAALGDLTTARDEQHQTRLDLENMTTARDTLAKELANRMVPMPQPIDAAHPLEAGERVRLVKPDGYSHALPAGSLGTVAFKGSSGVTVQWDDLPNEPPRGTWASRLERA